MTISKLTSIGAILATSLLIASAGAQSAARKAIERLNKEGDKAFKSKNIGWYQSVYAPDYYMFDGQSKIPRAGALDNIQHKTFEMMTIINAVTKIDKFHEDAKGVTVVNTTTYTIVEKPGAKATTFPFQYEQFWTNKGGKWQVHYLKLIVQTPKPIKPPAMKKRG